MLPYVAAAACRRCRLPAPLRCLCSNGCWAAALLAPSLQVEVDVYRSLGPKRAEPLPGCTSFFQEGLAKWRELCSAAHWLDAAAELAPLSQSLAQLLHHRDEIVGGVLLPRLRLEAALSLEPLLELTGTLARDLQQDYLPVLDQVLTALADLVDEGEALEAANLCPWCCCAAAGGTGDEQAAAGRAEDEMLLLRWAAESGVSDLAQMQALLALLMSRCGGGGGDELTATVLCLRCASPTSSPACRAGPGAGAAAAPVCLPLPHLQAPGQGAVGGGTAAAHAARHAAAAPPPRRARPRAGGRGARIPAQASRVPRAVCPLLPCAVGC